MIFTLIINNKHCVRVFFRTDLLRNKNVKTIGEMEAINEENQIEQNSLEKEAAEADASELLQPRWSVITYESVAVSNLTYDEALDWVKKLDEQQISGLCIVTDEAAAKIGNVN